MEDSAERESRLQKLVKRKAERKNLAAVSD
jgi:hypothetical protein